MDVLHSPTAASEALEVLSKGPTAASQTPSTAPASSGLPKAKMRRSSHGKPTFLALSTSSACCLTTQSGTHKQKVQ